MRATNDEDDETAIEHQPESHVRVPKSAPGGGGLKGVLVSTIISHPQFGVIFHRNQSPGVFGPTE